MINFGKVKPGTVLYIPFSTFGTDGQALTMSNFAVTDIEIYKDGSVTQRGSDSGYTLLDTDGIDFDGVTGLHGFSVDLADNTTAGFYAAGSKYFIHVASITVNTQTVNFIAATFEIEIPNALLSTTIASLSSQTSFTLTAGPAEDDALNGCVAYIHDVASAVQGGFAVVSDYTGATKTVTLTAGTTFTAAATDNVGFFPPANAGYAGAVVWGSGAITPGSIASNAITDAKIATGAITAAKFAAGAIDAAAVADGAIDAATFAAGAINAAAIANGAIDAATFAAGAIDAAAIADGAIDEAALAADARARIQTEAQEALQAYHLDHLLATAADGTEAANDSYMSRLVSKSATAAFSDYANTTDSLQALRDRGDAAWITATGFSTHSAADVWAVATRALTDKSNFRLSTTGVADIWAYVIEGTWTAVQFMRLFAAALISKCSGLGTATAVFRDVDDSKNRLSVTVDADGNRSAFGTRDGD